MQKVATGALGSAPLGMVREEDGKAAPLGEAGGTVRACPWDLGRALGTPCPARCSPQGPVPGSGTTTGGSNLFLSRAVRHGDGKTFWAVHIQQQNLGAGHSETLAAHSPGTDRTRTSHTGQVVTDAPLRTVTLPGQSREWRWGLGPLPLRPPGDRRPLLLACNLQISR